MSGGYFGYKQYELIRIADQLDELIASNDITELNEWGDCIGAGYSAATIAKFRECVVSLRRCEVMVGRIDWLLRCDDGEEPFHERWKKELR